jgi:hypothetical protein
VFYVNMTNGCIHVRALEKKPLHTKQRNINVVEDNQINIHTKMVSVIIVFAIPRRIIAAFDIQMCTRILYQYNNK